MKIDELLREPIIKGKASVKDGTSTVGMFALNLHKMYSTLYSKSMTPEEFYKQIDEL